MLGLGNSLTSGVVLDEFGTNHSILFDGTNDEIDFTTSGFQTALADANFKTSGSVSIWARVNTTSSNGQMWDFAIDSSNRIQMQYKQADDSFTAVYRAGGANKTANYAPPGTQEGDGNFHHIVATWDRGDDNELKLYSNNTLRFSLCISATALYFTFFGVGGGNYSSYFI